jgi:hypothetical protein
MALLDDPERQKLMVEAIANTPPMHGWAKGACNFIQTGGFKALQRSCWRSAFAMDGLAFSPK